MTELKHGKYGKYFNAVDVKSPPDGRMAQVFHVQALEDWGGARYLMGLTCIAKAGMIMDKAHSHHFTQLLVFIGSNAIDLKDFGAEIEVYMGKEGEKHVITSPTVVYIPGGFVHQPLNFKRVDKPVIMINIALTDERMGVKPEEM